MIQNLQLFASGAIMMGFLTLGWFFLAFYRRTSDRLFLYFAVAFFLLSAERVVLVLATPDSEADSMVYMVRMLAFGALAYAIWDRNRGNRSQ